MKKGIPLAACGLVLAVWAVVAGCQRTALFPPFYAVSFTNTVYPIVSANCFGCHANGGYASTYMNLGNPATASTVYAEWAGTGSGGAVISTADNCGYADYVDPGNASESLVYIKISGATCSPQMPDGGPYLSAAQVQEFQEWINEGAPDN